MRYYPLMCEIYNEIFVIGTAMDLLSPICFGGKSLYQNEQSSAVKHVKVSAISQKIQIFLDTVHSSLLAS